MTATNPNLVVSDRQAKRGPSSLFRAGLVVATAAVTALTWSIITIGFDTTIYGPTFDDAGPGVVGVDAVAMATLVSGLAGWVLLAAIERLTKRPTRIWTPTTLLAALLSLGGPLSGSGATAFDRLALVAAHLLVAAIYIPPMRRTANDYSGVRP